MKITALVLAGVAALSIYSVHSPKPNSSTPPIKPIKPAKAALRPQRGTNILPRTALAARYFGGDAPWYKDNIPFFDCSDPQITEIYYYRWKLYKSHLKDLGQRGYIVTEFLDDVGWSLKPYESLNDATAFHIHEGRWLRDPRYVDNYIDFMYHGGNDRHFSESIADAVYADFLATGDPAVAVRNLGAMRRLYRQWDDHYDTSKKLYYIEPLLDATEYTIASIDASGGRDGFGGGNAFRPTINSFMYANALAISRLSAQTGDRKSAQEYAARAAALRGQVQESLWNPQMQHFVDRFQADNQFVHYGDLIRGRELAGYTPWYFELPDQDARYAAAWPHLLSPDQLGGPYGLRTVEPSYQYYMKQYRYAREDGIEKPECQWNGPSWPFQTTLALGGLANLLSDYPRQHAVSTEDYVRLLQQYTRQHYVSGQPDLQEDYNPDTGSVIVGLHRSHHYNHSGYNDLVITGLSGLRPRADNILEINPLIPAAPGAAHSLSYLCLENVPYHGRLVTILYDRSGTHYRKGVGLSVWADGRRVVKASPLGRKTVTLPKNAAAPPAPALADLGVNLTRSGFPAPAASINTDPANLYQAVDGRVWYYPNVRNYWTNLGSPNARDWFSLDFGQPETVSAARLYFYGDGRQFQAPGSVALQYWTGAQWANVSNFRASPAQPAANGETVIAFSSVHTSRMRAVFANPQNASVALVEIKAYGTARVTAEPLTHGAGLPLDLAGLQEQNSRTGEFNGRQWRDADEGGFFAFDLGTAPNAANALVVTYWGGDAALGAAERRFDILVNGVKIAEQTLNNNQPGQFFDVSYPVPAALTQGKTKVTVRFQAHPGAIAGGIFGTRLVRR